MLKLADKLNCEPRHFGNGFKGKTFGFHFYCHTYPRLLFTFDSSFRFAFNSSSSDINATNNFLTLLV